MAVFVTDGDQRSTLAVVRSLGRAGVPVTVGETASRSLAGSSRYCAKSVRYPSPLENPESFVSFLRQELSGGEYDLLLPMTDITVQLVATARESLPPNVIVPFPSREKTELVQDKSRILSLAKELGIPCPETFVLREGEDIDSLAPKLRYPVVIKPRMSRRLHEGKWSIGAVQYAEDAASLVGKYRRIHDSNPYPMIQEKLEGEGLGVFLLIWDGEIKAAFCHRRLREKPPWGGVSVCSESLPPDEKLIRQSAALMKAVGWHGVAMVEYKVDKRDGLAKLMEINGRFWGSLQLAIDSGVDFPWLLYQCAKGVPIPLQPQYKVGVRSRWLLGDLDHLIIRLTHSRSPDGAPLSPPSRWKAMWNFMSFYERNTHHEVLRLSDPRPAWHEFRTYLRETWRGLRSRSGRVR